MGSRQDQPASGVPLAPQQDANLLIADVAALTGIPTPQLRSWEQAGLLHPRRSPKGMRLYGVEDVARARLIKRSLVKPGRRGSLRRMAAEFAAGALLPLPCDYAGLVNSAAGPVPLPDTLFWQAVVDAMAELVVVCDTHGRQTYANAALRAILPLPKEDCSQRPTRATSGEALPVSLAALPLLWAARTGSHHGELNLKLPRIGGGEVETVWTVAPLRAADGLLHGAVGVGRLSPDGRGTSPEDWMAMAAHDLRGPVTSILGRLQLARRVLNRSQAKVAAHGNALPEAPSLLDQHLAQAELSTLDLIRMMETLLDASAAAAGVLVQHLEAGGVDLDRLARQSVKHAQEHSSRHRITYERAGSPFRVAGDHTRLRQVLDNLLANAVKYSPDGGPITMRITGPASLSELDLTLAGMANGAPGAGAASLWVLLRVADSGLGIPSEALAKVFNRYWRAEGPTRLLPGSGLGLYTCRAIVAAHGGHIWIDRSAPAPEDGTVAVAWHGTVMAVLLPAERVATPAEDTGGEG
jgi:signal transduction histidine kinase